MEGPLVLTYDRLDDAERARAALLADGVRASDVRIVSREDGAGPVEGNFTLGNGRAAGASGDRYDDNLADVANRGTVLMTVDVAGAQARERAIRIARPFGALDVQRRTDLP